MYVEKDNMIHCFAGYTLAINTTYYQKVNLALKHAFQSAGGIIFASEKSVNKNTSNYFSL